jgi:hypothetical protein
MGPLVPAGATNERPELAGVLIVVDTASCGLLYGLYTIFIHQPEASITANNNGYKSRYSVKVHITSKLMHWNVCSSLTAVKNTQ